MKKTFLPFKKKLKHLKKLIRTLTIDSSEKVLREIKRLFAQLSFNLPSIYLRRTIMGSSLAIALLSGYNIHAQSFKAPVKNPFGLSSAEGIMQTEFVDIDGDNDLDLLSTGYYGDIKVYTNTGTKFTPNFGAATSNPYGLTGSGLPLTVLTSGDIDNDGDIDLFYCGLDYYAAGVLNIQFVENTGTATAPAYTAPTANPFGITAAAGFLGGPRLIDIDKDGDLDLIVNAFDYTTYSTSYLTYLNAGTASAPNFDPPITSAFGMGPEALISFPFFADVDKDGDVDLYNTDYYGNMIMYKDTSGLTGDPSFTNAGIIDPHGVLFPDQGIRFIKYVDIDGDNDLDLFATTSVDTATNESGLWFFQDSSSTVGIRSNPNPSLEFDIFPTLVSSELKVELPLLADDKTFVKITDAQGKVVLRTELLSKNNVIHVNELSAGAYFIEVENKQQKGVKKFIKE